MQPVYWQGMWQDGKGVRRMNIWARWLLISLAVWFFSVVGFAFLSMVMPGSPFVYVFGAVFSISILAALVFLFLLFRGLFDE